MCTEAASLFCVLYVKRTIISPQPTPSCPPPPYRPKCALLHAQKYGLQNVRDHLKSPPLGEERTETMMKMKCAKCVAEQKIPWNMTRPRERAPVHVKPSDEKNTGAPENTRFQRDISERCTYGLHIAPFGNTRCRRREQSTGMHRTRCNQ